MKITIVISVVASIATVLSETIADNSSLIARSNGRTHIGYRVVKKVSIIPLKTQDYLHLLQLITIS